MKKLTKTIIEKLVLEVLILVKVPEGTFAFTPPPVKYLIVKLVLVGAIP